MQILLSRTSLLYDIANLAYVIADVNAATAGEHAIHQTIDIKEEGNIDRINRILDLAYETVSDVMTLLLEKKRAAKTVREKGKETDCFRFTLTDPPCGFSQGHSLLLRENIREYMVCKALADWLSVTLPQYAGVWREKADLNLAALRELIERLARLYLSSNMRRRLYPF